MGDLPTPKDTTEIWETCKVTLTEKVSMSFQTTLSAFLAKQALLDARACSTSKRMIWVVAGMQKAKRLEMRVLESLAVLSDFVLE